MIPRRLRDRPPDDRSRGGAPPTRPGTATSISGRRSASPTCCMGKRRGCGWSRPARTASVSSSRSTSPLSPGASRPRTPPRPLTAALGQLSGHQIRRAPAFVVTPYRGRPRGTLSPGQARSATDHRIVVCRQGKVLTCAQPSTQSTTTARPVEHHGQAPRWREYTW
jgi:hypothetical protein